MMWVDPETLEYVETANENGEIMTIDGVKFWALTERVFAVITYRIQRACLALTEKRIDLKTLMVYIRRYFVIGNYALRKYGEDWIAKAETLAEKQTQEKTR